MRLRFSGAALAAVALLSLAAPPARADNYDVRDGLGNHQTMAAKLVAGVLHVRHQLEMLVGGVPTDVSAGQATKANSLPVTLASDPDLRVTAANITAADVASTTVAGQGSVTLVTGTPTAGSSVTWQVNGHSSLTIGVAGTFVLTAPIESSPDCVTYGPSNAKLAGSGAIVGSVTAPGTFRVDVTGMACVRLRATAFTSGSLAALANASNAAGLTQVLNPLRLSDASGAVTGVSANPFVTAPQYIASGVAPVTAALTSATCTSAFTPVAGRGFNVSGWGTFVASYQMVRSFDGGTTKLPITAGGTQLYVWPSPASEQAEETEFGVSYYVCVTSYTSGTLNIRISQ